MTRYHLIGIGGAGMAPVAELLAARGLEVSGSDARPGATIDRLRAGGITAHVGHDAAQVPEGATVVVSTAVRADNPELVRVRELGLEVIHRSEALVVAAGDQEFVAVAGAHGKTTTSAMLAVALSAADEDPSWAIGGHVTGLGGGAHLGSGRVFVAEADESDGSFLNYRPAVAVVTNVEPDHLDHYGSRAAFDQAFTDFAARVTGLLVVCADDDGALALGRRAAGQVPVLTYGTGPEPGVGEGHVRVSELTVGAAGAGALLTHPAAGRVRLELGVTGEHNVRNATGAWCAGVALGADPTALAEGLGSFRGTGRRFEHRGEAAGVRVVDDYAHHPTEVAATLGAARLAAGGGRVVVLFQPHLYSRTETFAAEFATALGAADEVVVTDVYAAREDPVPGVDGSLITARMSRGQYVADREAAAGTVARLARPGDLVLTMGAGDVTELGPRILQLLAERA